MAMASSPQPELHRILRRLDFPQSAKEALVCLGKQCFMLELLHHVLIVKLYILEQLCMPLAHTRPPTAKQLDYIGEIIDEFIFCEKDHKGIKRKVRI